MFETIVNGPVWNSSYFGNSVGDYMVALLTFAVIIFFINLVKNFVKEKVPQTTESTRYSLINSVGPVFIAYFSACIASRTLLLHNAVEKILSAILILWIIYIIIDMAEILINKKFEKKKGEEEDEIDVAAMTLIKFGVKIVLSAIGLLMALTNLGVDVTSLAAGLGIGGIAVALAAQNILGDLFSSLSIYLDKPFTVGDTITYGNLVGNNNTGTVEKIGMKTTRLRGPSGEEIVVSNKELTTARIQNFKKMSERRITFLAKVSPETPAKKIKEIRNWIEEIIAKENNTRTDRIHFKNFGETAFEFEVVYFVLSSDYRLFMDIQHNINIAIAEKFEKEKIFGLSGKTAPKLEKS